MKLNEQIKFYRMKANMTQQELADKLPCDVKTVSKYETGKLGVSAEVLERLAEILSFEINIVKTSSDVTDKYFSFEELMEINNQLVNFTDKLIIQLLFESLTVDELVNLKYEDIDIIEHNLHLPTGRELKISNYCIDLIKETVQEKSYNEVVNNERVKKPLENSDYLIRRIDGSKKNRKLMTLDRIFFIKEHIKRETFTVNSIRQSGAIFQGKEYLEKKGHIEETDIEKIAERLQYSSVNQLKDIVNEKNVYSLYPKLKINSKMKR